MMEQRLAGYLESYKPMKLQSRKEQWDHWTPREEFITEDRGSQVGVRVSIIESGRIFDWKLRRGVEWADFKYLVNSYVGREEWIAFTEGYIWDGDTFNGCLVRPHENQVFEIVDQSVLQCGSGKVLSINQQQQADKIKKREEIKRKAWEKLASGRPNMEDWELT
jgi:hypothetical protein